MAELVICSPITKEPMAKVVRTTGQECVGNRLNQVSTSSGAVALTLPQSYTSETCVVIEDTSGDASTNNITITGGANGQLIDGEASIKITRAFGALALVRNVLSNQWSIALIPRELDGARVRLYTSQDAKVWLASPPILTSLNYDQGDTEGGGASIVLTGSNFFPTSVAYFDGVAATTVSTTPTSLTCTLPPHAAGSVFVTARNGGAESLPLPFEYWSPLDTDGAGTNLAGLTGLWRADGTTGYTFTDGGPGARNGTLVDAIAARNASSASDAFPKGAAAGGHVPPQGTRTTSWLAQINTVAAQSTFIANNLFTMWSFTETPSEGINSWPDGSGTWAGCYLISCGTALSAHLGLTGTNSQPDPAGSARVVIYNGGINNCQVNGLALDTPYFVVGTLSGGTARIRAGGLTATLAVGGTISDLTTPLRLGCNANATVSQRGPQYEHATMNQLLSDADRAKVLKYGQQRYGRAFT